MLLITLLLAERIIAVLVSGIELQCAERLQAGESEERRSTDAADASIHCGAARRKGAHRREPDH